MRSYCIGVLIRHALADGRELLLFLWISCIHVNERTATQATNGCLLSDARKALPLPAPSPSSLDPELETSHRIDSSV